MRMTKKVLSMLVSLAVAASLTVSAFAGVGNSGSQTTGGSGTDTDPYIGGADFADTYAGSITIHKWDIAAYEKAESATYGSELVYEGYSATGVTPGATTAVGFLYAAGDASKTVVKTVMLADLTALANIPFRIESVVLDTGKTPGSTDPADYIYDSGADIDSYARTAATTGEILWSGLPAGYYRVTEIVNSTSTAVDESSYIISVPMVDPANTEQTIKDVHVYPKNRAVEAPGIDKEAPTPSDIDANAISWKITADVPATIKGTKGDQSYVITDTMGTGLTYVPNSLVVYYENSGTPVTLTAGTDYTLVHNASARTLKITLDDAGYAKLAAAIAGGTMDSAPAAYKLYVTYDTIVKVTDDEWDDLVANGAVDPITNEIELEFTNDDGSNYKSEGDTPVNPEDLAKLKVIKYDGTTAKPTDVGQSGTTYLAGAQFKVYTALSGTSVDTSSVLKDAAGTEIILTTGADGSISYNGLGAGDYYLVEIVPPANYKQLTGHVKVTITAQNAADNATITAAIDNYLDNGLTLPKTGGMGTYLFLAAGIVLIGAAGILLVISKRKRAAE